MALSALHYLFSRVMGVKVSENETILVKCTSV